MRRPRQRVRVKRWEGLWCDAKQPTGIGFGTKQKASLVLAKDKRVRSALPVALFLLDAVNTETGRLDWSIPRIASELNMGRSTVFRALKVLHKCGYLTWKRHRGAGYTNLYSWCWQVLFSEAEEVQGESEGRTERVQVSTTSDTPPVSDMRQTHVRNDTQIREEKDNKKENITTNQKEARQKQEGRRKTAHTQQPVQFGLRTFSVVKGGYDADTASKGVAPIKARERVQKVLSENSLWRAAMENNSAFEAAILAEQMEPGTGLQAFNAALEQSAEDAGKVALCL